MVKILERNPVVTIIVLVGLMLCFNIGILEVSIMEARNFITAREMITDGNWLLTTMNGEARYQKPPLPTWLAAISAMIFGLKSIFALRLPGILMVAATGIASYYLSRKLLGDKSHALINALITITSFYVIGIVIEAPWDIFTHGFMLIGIYQLYLLFNKQEQYWKHTLLSGLFIGLSMMCKGPISIYALLLPFLLAYGITFRYKNFKAKAFSIFSVLIIALLIGGWWYFYVRWQDPDTFMAIANQETSNWGSYNVRPFYYYWSFFTQSGLWTIPAFIALLYPYMKSRVSHPKAFRLSFLWTVFAVILLSIIPEKKSRYLMPVLIPLAINTGFYIEYLIRRFKDLRDKRETFPVYFNFGLIALIGIAFPIAGHLILQDEIEFVWPPFYLAALILFIIGILMLWHLRKKQLKSVFYLTIGFMVAVLLFVLPLSRSLRDFNYASISNLKAEAESENIKVYGLNNVSPETIWQYGDKIPRLKAGNSSFHFPEAKKFGILAYDIAPKDKMKIAEQYTMELRATYNLNTVSPQARGYKSRLINEYYVLTKK